MAKKRQDNDEIPDENNGNADDSADNFGLPDIDYKPLEREEERIESDATTAKRKQFDSENSGSDEEDEVTDERADEEEEEEESSSSAPMIISIIIGLVVIAAGFLLYSYVYKPKKEKERLEQEKLAVEAKVKAHADSVARAESDALKYKQEDEVAVVTAKPTIGTIETLSERTGKFYVVVASDVDVDLVMDYAQKLSVKGVSSWIIPPFGQHKYHRLTIGDFGSYAEAQTSADASKAEYGTGVWVIKY